MLTIFTQFAQDSTVGCMHSPTPRRRLVAYSNFSAFAIAAMNAKANPLSHQN